jgi:hypothetical protein
MWIKVSTQLITKPEVFAISQALTMTRAEVVGHLVSIWSWFDANSETGEMRGCCSMVDTLTANGFADAMQAVNWLNCDDGKITLPNFSRHNGSTAKKRAQGQARQKKFREKAEANATSVTDASPEKIRIDKSKDTIPYNKVVDLWNNSNSPKISRLTDKRRTLIRRLCKEFTLEQIEEVFKKVPTIPFLVGENERNWRADLEYTAKPDKFLKILEGGWDVKPTSTASKASFNEWNN